MVHGLWCMVYGLPFYGLWCMVYGLWFMVYFMVYGLVYDSWFMVHGSWFMVYGLPPRVQGGTSWTGPAREKRVGARDAPPTSGTPSPATTVCAAREGS